MKTTALMAGLVAIIACSARAQTTEPNEIEKGVWVDDPVCQTVFFAVLEGLYQDGVSNETLDLIIPPDPKSGEPIMTEHFVYACPLCHPAFDAMRLYRSRKPFHGLKPGNRNTMGGGLDESVIQRLRGEVKTDRLAVVQELIQEWVGRRLDDMRLTAEERAEWTRRLEVRRQQGAERLKQFQAVDLPGNWPEEVKESIRNSPFRRIYSDWKACAVCDGSMGACKTR